MVDVGAVAYPQIMRRGAATLLLLCAITVAAPALALDFFDKLPGEIDFSGEISAEGQGFFRNSPKGNVSGSVNIRPELQYLINQDFAFEIRPRFTFREREADADLETAKIDASIGRVTATLGYDTLFWGVTEGAQILNIINQEDLAADFDGDVRRGQLMLRLGTSLGPGQLDLYALPIMPLRRFRTTRQRLDNGFMVDSDDPVFRDANNQYEPAFALRYGATFGALDLGIVAFQGLNRRPTLLPAGEDFVPFYSTAGQIGGDLQFTYDNIILKGELLHSTAAPTRLGTFKEDTSFVVGGEYAFFGIGGTDADLTLVTEYSRSSLGTEAFNGYQNDILLALRTAFNDTASTTLRVALLYDADHNSNLFEILFRRRFLESFLLEADMYIFDDVKSGDFLSGFKPDSHFHLRLTKYF